MKEMHTLIVFLCIIAFVQGGVHQLLYPNSFKNNGYQYNTPFKSITTLSDSFPDPRISAVKALRFDRNNNNILLDTQQQYNKILYVGSVPILNSNSVSKPINFIRVPQRLPVIQQSQPLQPLYTQNVQPQRYAQTYLSSQQTKVVPISSLTHLANSEINLPYKLREINYPTAHNIQSEPKIPVQLPISHNQRQQKPLYYDNTLQQYFSKLFSQQNTLPEKIFTEEDTNYNTPIYRTKKIHQSCCITPLTNQPQKSTNGYVIATASQSAPDPCESKINLETQSEKKQKINEAQNIPIPGSAQDFISPAFPLQDQTVFDVDRDKTNQNLYQLLPPFKDQSVFEIQADRPYSSYGPQPILPIRCGDKDQNNTPNKNLSLCPPSQESQKQIIPSLPNFQQNKASHQKVKYIKQLFDARQDSVSSESSE